MRFVRNLLPVLAALSLAGAALAETAYAPKYAPARRKICIERYETNGVQNIQLTKLTIDHVMTAELTGGGAFCAYTGDSPITLTLKWSADVYKPSNLQTQELHIPKGTALENLVICAASDKSHSWPNWLLIPRRDDARCTK